MKTGARTLAICRQMLFIHHEQEVLVERDPDAPEVWSPNHTRYETLAAEWATLADALTKAPAPRTLQGIKALAQVAMTLTDPERSPKDGNFAPEHIVEWVTLRTLTSAAGKPEAIPLPNYLPDYWPA